jgi:hypothetical protein
MKQPLPLHKLAPAKKKKKKKKKKEKGIIPKIFIRNHIEYFVHL